MQPIQLCLSYDSNMLEIMQHTRCLGQKACIGVEIRRRQDASTSTELLAGADVCTFHYTVTHTINRKGLQFGVALVLRDRWTCPRVVH
jgi:hypothetical protein